MGRVVSVLGENFARRWICICVSAPHYCTLVQRNWVSLGEELSEVDMHIFHREIRKNVMQYRMGSKLGTLEKFIVFAQNMIEKLQIEG